MVHSGAKSASIPTALAANSNANRNEGSRDVRIIKDV